MVGKSIAHYRIEAELGRSGMGLVYRAHNERLLAKLKREWEGYRREFGARTETTNGALHTLR